MQFSFVAFFFIFFVFAVLNRGKLAYAWDEFSHWVDIVKVMTNINDFGTNPESSSAFKSYPPAISIFQYFVQKVNLLIHPTAEFSEWKVYWAFQIFFLLPAFPFFKKQSFKRPVSLLILVLCVTLCPLILYDRIYDTTYVDCVLSLLSGYGLAMVALWDEKDEFYTLNIAMLCAMLVLYKDAGLVFVLILAVAYMADFAMRKRTLHQKLIRRSYEVGLILLPLIFLVVSKCLWKLEVYLSKCYVSFETHIDFGVLKGILLGQDTTYRAEVVKNFWKALFVQGKTLQPFGITVPFAGVIAIEVILLWFGYRLYLKKSV